MGCIPIDLHRTHFIVVDHQFTHKICIFRMRSGSAVLGRRKKSHITINHHIQLDLISLSDQIHGTMPNLLGHGNIPDALVRFGFDNGQLPHQSDDLLVRLDHISAKVSILYR